MTPHRSSHLARPLAASTSPPATTSQDTTSVSLDQRNGMPRKKRAFGTCKYSILLLMANVLYIYLGTLMFISLEGPSYAEEAIDHYDTLQHYMEHLGEQKKLLPQLLDLQKKMCKKNNEVEKSWHFTGAITYCLSILSTVGYGVMTPHDSISRGVTMVYALFGLPIYAVFLNHSSSILEYFLSGLSNLILWCARGTRKEKWRNEEGPPSERCLLSSEKPSPSSGVMGHAIDLVLADTNNERRDIMLAEQGGSEEPCSSKGGKEGDYRTLYILEDKKQGGRFEGSSEDLEISVERTIEDMFGQLRKPVLVSQHTDETLMRRPALLKEHTEETLLSNPSGDSIDQYRRRETRTTTTTSDLFREHNRPFSNTHVSNTPRVLTLSPSAALALNLLLSLIMLFTYIIVLLVWCPPAPDETVLDEIYWLVIRFTTVGFGDEFRDISRSPEHLPGTLNAIIVSLFVLPLGISIASHIFHLYRKVAADRLRRAKQSKGIRVRFECEFITED